jgi:hypothetical protein
MADLFRIPDQFVGEIIPQGACQVNGKVGDVDIKEVSRTRSF